MTGCATEIKLKPKDRSVCPRPRQSKKTAYIKQKASNMSYRANLKIYQLWEDLLAIREPQKGTPKMLLKNLTNEHEFISKSLAS